jgi:hypothetical protein
MTNKPQQPEALVERLRSTVTLVESLTREWRDGHPARMQLVGVLKAAANALSRDAWVPVTEALPSKTDQTKTFLCTFRSKNVEPYVAEMTWVGGKQQWFGDNWSGDIIAWRELPAPYAAIKEGT